MTHRRLFSQAQFFWPIPHIDVCTFRRDQSVAQYISYAIRPLVPALDLLPDRRGLEIQLKQKKTFRLIPI